MEINEIGEFGLIGRLTKDLPVHNAATLQGAGDDCAVIDCGDRLLLVSSQLFMEGVQFDLTYIDMEHLAYKVVMATASNVFAMNGAPRQLTVSIGLGKRFKIEDLDAFYKGLRTACDKWGIDIVGGDTTSSYTGLAIALTCVGEAAKGEAVYRRGAKETDLVCVSGDLGAAYMGLQILEREKTVYYQQVDEYNREAAEAKAKGDQAKLKALQNKRTAIEGFQPDFAGKEYLIDRQLKPEARGDVLRQLREAGIHPTAMTDISDGLAAELRHLCEQSHCGCRIYEKNIPIDYQTAAACEEFNMNLTTAALSGGEDYELLFTIPIGDHEKIEGMEGIRQIGYITQEQFGRYLIMRDGQEFELRSQGWGEAKQAQPSSQA